MTAEADGCGFAGWEKSHRLSMRFVVMAVCAGLDCFPFIVIDAEADECCVIFCVMFGGMIVSFSALSLFVLL